MNCNDSQRIISAERDGALNDNQRSALKVHLDSCESCRQFRASLSAAADSWKSADASVALPDAGKEWLSIRRRLRQETGDSPASSRPARWFGVPLGAMAAVAFAIVGALVWMRSPIEQEKQTFAEVESVEVDDESASVVVFVDEESGWLVVWAVPELVETGT